MCGVAWRVELELQGGKQESAEMGGWGVAGWLGWPGVVYWAASLSYTHAPPLHALGWIPRPCRRHALVPSPSLPLRPMWRGVREAEVWRARGTAV